MLQNYRAYNMEDTECTLVVLTCRDLCINIICSIVVNLSFLVELAAHSHWPRSIIIGFVCHKLDRCYCILLCKIILKEI